MSLDVSGTCRTSDPTLTAGQKYSLKMDTLGNVGVLIANTSAVPVSSTLAAAENHVGEINQPYNLLDLVPVCDTAIYASGDVLFTATVTGNLMRVNDGKAILKSLQIIDKDDQGIAMDIYFFSSAVTFGAVNGVPSISDADLATCLGYVSVATGDYKDLGGARIATKNALDIILKAVSGAKTIYVAAVTQGGTPTYTAAGLTLRLGVIQG